MRRVSRQSDIQRNVRCRASGNPRSYVATLKFHDETQSNEGRNVVGRRACGGWWINRVRVRFGKPVHVPVERGYDGCGWGGRTGVERTDVNGVSVVRRATDLTDHICRDGRIEAHHESIAQAPQSPLSI